jgi:hypothetical protein
MSESNANLTLSQFNVKMPIEYFVSPIISPNNNKPNKKKSPFYNRLDGNKIIAKAKEKLGNSNNTQCKSSCDLQVVKFSNYPFERECSDRDLTNPRFIRKT